MSAISNKLYTSIIEDPAQLVSVYEELHGWTSLATGSKLENYHFIAESCGEAVMDILGTSNLNVEAGAFKHHRVVVAMDPKGNLQGVCLYEMERTCAKLDLMVTAFWNLDEANPDRVKGVGTAMIAHIACGTKNIESIVVDTTKQAKPFYTKCKFVLVSHWKKTKGAVCGMQLPKSSFELYTKFFNPAKESELPPINEHYIGLLGQKFKNDLLKEVIQRKSS